MSFFHLFKRSNSVQPTCETTATAETTEVQPTNSQNTMEPNKVKETQPTGATAETNEVQPTNSQNTMEPNEVKESQPTCETSATAKSNEPEQPKIDQPDENAVSDATPIHTDKTRIYNLIVLDKSGSMEKIRTAAYQGCNEVLGGIRAAAEQNQAEQEQFVSLLLFDTQSMSYIYRCTPAAQAVNLTEKQYKPCACTPLYDAMGQSLTELEHEVTRYDDAVAMVTIITDGYENASREYNQKQIHALIERLKRKGWNFAFMGANQDVNKVCIDLNINVQNAVSFSYDDAGMRDSWRRDREAKERYYERMRHARQETRKMSCEEREAYYFQANEASSYFEEERRITPQWIRHLRENEIFVFGSNAEGHHGGGAAAVAMHNFGAIYGQGEGLQGTSYAIPTMGTLEETQAAVERFIEFARQHRELRFMVTPIGCGIAGYQPADIAPLFRPATTLKNVYLPKSFWDCL